MSSFIVRNIRKIKVANQLKKNRERRAIQAKPQNRFTPGEYNALQARLTASGEGKGAREYLEEIEALQRRVRQMNKNKSRPRGKRSPYKLSGIRE